MSDEAAVKAVATAIAALRNVAPTGTDEDFARKFLAAYRAMEKRLTSAPSPSPHPE